MKTVIGQQVARVRKFRGWTQRELADFAQVSYSLLTKVESGHVPASQAFVAACARALRVRVEELTGQPYRGESPASDRADAGVAGLRTVLWEHPIDPDAAGRPLAELRPVLADAERLRQAARFVELVEMLPKLVRELLGASTTTSGFALEQVFGALAGAYALAQTATRFLGYADVAALCVERMFWAARRSGDPLWLAVATEKRGHLQLLAGAYDAGLRAMAAAQAELAGDDRPPALAVAGTLHLRAGILAARAARADRARAELDAAAEYADRLPASGEQEDWYGLAFGRPNVQIHQVAAEVELGEGTRAVALAARLGDPAGQIEASRVGHHYIDLARAQLLHGDRHAALDALQAARRAAPQQTRHHPMVRETLDVLARAQRVPEALGEFTTWIGVPLLGRPPS